MSMASLLAWRRTCRDVHLLATKEVRHTLHILLARFTPNPMIFLKFLTRWGALVVGEAALSHVLHDPTLCDKNLELAVSNLVFEPFVRRLQELIPFGTHVLNSMDKPAPPSFPFLRHITRIAEFHLVTGKVIHVYESATPSACDVVSGAWTTALMNFVTASSFGCAYPRLTLNYQAILCDGRKEAMRWLDSTTHALLSSKGFDFRAYSPAWATFCTGPYSLSSPSIGGCGKLLHVCPAQGRYFGDPGSLVIFFDEFFVDLDTLRDMSIAPYGLMSAWRIPTKGTCEGRCAEDETVVPAFVISMPIQFMEDRPISNRPEIGSQRRIPPVPTSLTLTYAPSTPLRRYTI